MNKRVYDSLKHSGIPQGGLGKGRLEVRSDIPNDALYFGLQSWQMMKSIFVITVLIYLPLASFGQAANTANSVLVKVKKNNNATNWDPCKTTLLKHLEGFKTSPLVLSKYGGRTDRKEKATGFFYTTKSDAGWVMVDPEGCHYVNIGVNATSPNDEAPDHKEAFVKKFKDRSTWAKKTKTMLVGDLKFNSLGCWSDWTTFKEAGAELPYMRRWNLMASYGRKKGITQKGYGHEGFRDDVLPVFDKGFAEHCDEICKAMSETKDDPWLVGHFSDNELPFKSPGIVKRYLKCPAEDESRIAVESWLKEKRIDVEKITTKHDTEFAALVLRTYYKTVHDAIRRHDPNHMILGSRLHGQASSQDICYTASGPFVDVVSINYYNRWTPDQAELDRRAGLAKKPILISEWYAKGVDSGLNNSKGAGFTVPTQAERGMFYENFTIGLLKNRNVVGWHWFRYIDDGDLKTGGLSCNKGIVNMQYVEYHELVVSMKAINAAAYQLSDFLRGHLANVLEEQNKEVNK